MGGVAVGLALGAGLFCIWWACWAVEDAAADSSAAPAAARAPAATGTPGGRRPHQPSPRLPGRRVPAGGFSRYGRRRLGTALRADLAAADLPLLTWSRLLAVSAVVGLLAAIAVVALTGVPALAAGFGAFAAYLPAEAVRSRARRRARGMRDVWPDVVDNIASAVRAGMALPEAVAQVGHRGPAMLRPAFAEFAQDYRLTGRFGDGLDLLKFRLADPVADRLIESLRLARDVGGSDLGQLLRTLSAFLRDDARTRAELEARQSWSVNAARLAVVAPWLVLGMLATRADALRAYAGPAGTLVLAVGLGVTVLAYRIMRRIGRLPVEERVLR